MLGAVLLVTSLLIMFSMCPPMVPGEVLMAADPEPPVSMMSLSVRLFTLGLRLGILLGDSLPSVIAWGECREPGPVAGPVPLLIW